VSLGTSSDGVFSGHAKFTNDIYSCLKESQHEKYVVFLDEADGTEEIPANVSAVVLKHEVPQLSHIAIRARQSKILFVCCENS